MVLARIVVAARRVDEDLAVGLAIAVPLREELKQRFARDFRHRVPDGHVDRADGDGPLTVATGLLVDEHRRPDLVGIEVVAGVVDQRGRGGLEQARDEALAHQLALTVTAVRVEAVADHRLAVANDVRDDRDETQGHFAEVDVGVPDRGTDRNGFFADFNDSHATVSRELNSY